ncbi:hypothetical protein TanjilG_26957 [Lupinus angustifolius]|uniref:DUF4378 domain-containing protein n=1 Tax=Lupinus angustifolius TaxID=3871 RepID=A0A1J7H0D6_LUPAN|nr:PREDICTED: uncharacterized protein LOC109330253 isoform X2 [Lupinus angustifolius]OIV95260.1 hypothetical protein TanjilG_26957 [Lupinus angustifolius]
MEMEKKRSKGSFFSLFDWNSKSRKKLIWNNPTLPEGSKQGKENVENMPKTQISRIKVDENGASPSNTGCSDFSCALSISSDEEYGSKAPGLVARLMGLDSLPTSAVTELSSTSLYGSNSHGASRCDGDALYSENDFLPVEYINVPLKVEKSSRDAMESGAHKVGNWQMKRFQTEMLPPKSAKTIPVTHNKLLSPIKNPGFVSPRNAAHIMEASCKIIEGSPRPYTRNKMSSVGPSSAPLRTRDLKERLEALLNASVPGKSVGPSTANLSNGKPSDSSSNLYKRAPAFKGSRVSEKTSSCNLASKGKSVSQAIQAQTNTQSGGTLASNGNKNYRKQKERTQIKSNHFSRNQKPSTEQVMQQKTGTSRNGNVLRKNNQKQNSLTNKGKSTSKIDSNKPTTQTSSSESSTGTRRTVNKGAINGSIQCKRSNSRATVNQKEFPSSDSISQKKRDISTSIHEARGPDKAVNNLESKSIKCNITTDGSIDQDDAFNMKESEDVISFTFTSPLRRSMPGSLSSAEQVVGSRNIIGVDFLGRSDNLYPKKLSLSPPRLPMIDGDTLSDLLEKKLQELTSRSSLPQCPLAIEESSADLRSTVQDKVPILVNTTSEEQDRSFHLYLFSDKRDSIHGCHSSNDDPVFYVSQQLQTSEVMEDPSCSSYSENGNDSGCKHPRAVTVSESPSASQSYVDSEDGAYGSTIYSSMQDEEVSNFSEISESVSLENEVSSGRSSSIWPVENMSVKQLSEITNLADFKRSRETGLEYVHDILTNAEFMAEEFVIGQTNTVIMPNVFDRLVNASNGTEDCEEYSMLEMKIVFDFVSECIELKCKQAFVGSCKQWFGLMRSIKRKNWLAQEFYKQMLGFRNTEEDVMIDELVSNDMSTGRGRWLEFDVEAFEEGIEIEEDILDILMDELVYDLLHV